MRSVVLALAVSCGDSRRLCLFIWHRPLDTARHQSGARELLGDGRCCRYGGANLCSPSFCPVLASCSSACLHDSRVLALTRRSKADAQRARLNSNVRPHKTHCRRSAMSSVKRIQFTVEINAPVSVVWRHVTSPESYRIWTSAFAEGSHFKGSWEQGSKIQFLSPSGDGMVAEIAENRGNEFISIRHLGFIANGVGTPQARPSKTGRLRMRTTPSSPCRQVPRWRWRIKTFSVSGRPT